MNWFEKLLFSSKLQIAIIVLGMIVFLVIRYKLNPEIAATESVKLAIAYFGARVAEPVVEYALSRLGKPKSSQKQGGDCER